MPVQRAVMDYPPRKYTGQHQQQQEANREVLAHFPDYLRLPHPDVMTSSAAVSECRCHDTGH
jgi:hypothetical protein